MTKLCPNIMGMPTLPGAHKKIEGAFDGWESEAFDCPAWYAKGFDAGGFGPTNQLFDAGPANARYPGAG
jgi:hypothetical protein